MRPAFDAITRYIFSINEPWLTQAAHFFDVYTPLIYLIAVLLFVNTLRMQKRFIKTILAVLLATLIVFMLKYTQEIPRPCMLDQNYIKVECPASPDFSFPSGHEAIASAVLAPFVGTSAFPIFLVLALVTGFLRINLGVHFLNDVLGGFVIGFFSYDIIDRIISEGTLTLRVKPHDTKFEIRRQLLHISVGIFILLLLLAFTAVYHANGETYVEFIIFVGLLSLLVMIHDRISGKEHKITTLLFNLFERSGARQGYGAFWYGMGVLLLFVFINDTMFLAASLIALAVGDGVATIVGRMGKHRNPLNPHKTIEGSLAFFLSTAILTYPLIGPLALALSILTMLAEMLPPKFDDNFMIPLVCIIFYILFF